MGRFRWGWIALPVGCLVAAWLMASFIAPGFDWEDIMDLLHVHPRNLGRYTRLAVLGLVLIGIVAVSRIVRKRKNAP